MLDALHQLVTARRDSRRLRRRAELYLPLDRDELVIRAIVERDRILRDNVADLRAILQSILDLVDELEEPADARLVNVQRLARYGLDQPVPCL